MSAYRQRVERVRAAMVDQDVDVVLLSVGPDLPYLTGYEAMPLERLTMLVLPRDDDATLVVPRLEAPRVVEQPGVFTVRPWNETDDPIDIVAGLAKGAGTAAIGDKTWARFLVDLSNAMPATTFRRANGVVGPIRMRKDAAEIAALRAVGAAADRVAVQLQSGAIALAGRTEAAVSADISRRLLAEGHERVNFAIVASGPNGASPHHEAAGRVLSRGDVVVCDFGGRMDGYCSDITRTVAVGEPSAEIAEAYAVLQAAQQAAVAAAVVGTTCEAVDAVARSIITDAGYGDRFIHRTGHGIGMEEHEDPYIVAGNVLALEPGHAFSIEPGIYTAGSWGMRLEDIVVATPSGPEAMNNVDHTLVVVDA
jgi:Xaa-Pro aminopeptidase